MSSENYLVPPRSWENIGITADKLRNSFGLGDEPYFPVFDFLERILDQRLGLVRFEVEDFEGMDGAEGLTDPNGEFIALREDVYLKGVEHDGRARFTAAHELGHFILHTNIPLARAPTHGQTKIFRLSEPQANQFAAEILMPRKFITPNDSIQSIVSRHGVSYEAADNRLRNMKKVWSSY